MSAQHTAGPFTPSTSVVRWPIPARGEDREGMMDFSIVIEGIAPFTENEHGGYEHVEEQAVGKAFGRTAAEAKANAALFAAAPELLEALQSAVESFEQLVKLDRIPANMKGLRDARAAIAKATGSAA